MRHLIRDVGFGLRLLARKPGFAAAAVLTLILGIGLNTAVFTLLDALFLRPLPVDDPASLVKVYMSHRNDAGEIAGRISHSHTNFLDLRERSRSFAGLSLHQWWPVNLSGGSEPLRATGMWVSASYFEILGLEPALGRFFLPEEDETPGTHPVVVLSHGCWTRLFGADPGVLGRTVRINGRPMTVVGVAPRGFSGIDLTVDVDLWMPVMMYPETGPSAQWFDARGGSMFPAFGRLRPGVSRAAAESELSKLYQDLEAAYPGDFEGVRGVGAVVRPLLESTFPGDDRQTNFSYGKILAGAVGLILLLSCLTVAHLLLARGTARAREIAVRQAMGAGRRRLVAQLVTENLALFLLAGALSLPVGRGFLALLWRLRPPQFSAGAVDLDLDLRTFAFALATAAVTGLLFGLLPAIRAARLDLVAQLKDSAAASAGGAWPRWLRPRRLLVVGQVAVTLVALVAAGLFLRSARNAYRIDLGFDAGALLAVSFAPGDQGYEKERTKELYRRAQERVAALPGVRSVALSENRLLRGAVWRRQIFLPGRDEPIVAGGSIFHRVNAVSPGFFATAGIPLLQGRDFDGGDREDGPRVAVVNQTMAELAWPGEEAIGQHLQFDYPTEPPVEVVGVARDARYRHVHEARQFFVYVSAEQFLPASATLHVRAAGDPAELLEVVRREVRALDPDLPLADVQTLARFVDQDLWKERASAALLAVFGALALALATLGVYGVLAQSVEQRRREIGIRLAIGAGRGELLRRVLGEGAAMIAAGVAAGLVLAYLGLRLTAAVDRQLIDVNAGDPLTYGLAALVLFGAALLGCLLPARRAVATDPVATLREE